jgi:transposase
LSWSETATVFKTSWNTVCRSVQWVVGYGLENRNLDGVSAIGVDEVAYSKGHQYMTLVYQIDQGKKRLLGVIKKRSEAALEGFFDEVGADWCSKIKVVCSDMWRPYLNVVREKLPEALNILDRFHIVKKLNEAVDQIRREEAKRLKDEGYEPVLQKSRYSFLKRPENLTETQRAKLDDVLAYDLKTNRAYLLKEAFDAFWHYKNPYWAKWFMRKWCTRAMRSRIEPMKKFVKTLRNHEDLLMNYFKANKQYSSGIVEGMNLRVNLSMRKAFGYRSFDLLQVSLFHQLGDLPEPEFTHRFC